MSEDFRIQDPDGYYLRFTAGDWLPKAPYSGCGNDNLFIIGEAGSELTKGERQHGETGAPLDTRPPLV